MQTSLKVSDNSAKQGRVYKGYHHIPAPLIRQKSNLLPIFTREKSKQNETAVPFFKKDAFIHSYF